MRVRHTDIRCVRRGVFKKNATHTRPTRLGEKIQQIRIALDLSQSEMLERLGFGTVLFRSNVSQYELGTREPPLLVLIADAQLANALVKVLIDDDLDLPAKLPSTTNHKGVGAACRTADPRLDRLNYGENLSDLMTDAREAGRALDEAVERHVMNSLPCDGWAAVSLGSAGGAGWRKRCAHPNNSYYCD